MSRIIGIHGVGAQHLTSPQLTTAWWDAIRGGLEISGNRPLAESLTPDDFRVVHYGDLFLQGVGAATTIDTIPDDPEDLPEQEQALILALYEAALLVEPELADGSAEMVEVLSLRDILLRLLRSKTFSGIVRRFLLRDFRQVNVFLEQDEVRESCRARLAEEIGDDTRVIIAHSLGSVVAYEYLCADPGDVSRVLLTIGSPLGMPNIIFDRLHPAPQAGLGMWPNGVESWSNFSDGRDIVALQSRLADHFTPPAGIPKIDDRQVDNGDKPHDAARYLVTKDFGSALAQALR